MNNSKRSGLVALVLGPMLALMLSACVVVPAHRPYYTTGGPEGGATVDYGDYYYYPHAEVYYSISTGYYFYRSGGAWLRARVLPGRYTLNPRYRIRVQAPRRRPYERFREHQRLYRNTNPSQWQNNRNWDRGRRIGNEPNELDRRDRERGIYMGPGPRNENRNILRRSPRGEPIQNGRREYRQRLELNRNRGEQRRLEPQRNQREQRRHELQRKQQGKTNDHRGRSRKNKKSNGQDQGGDNQDQQQNRLP